MKKIYFLTLILAASFFTACDDIELNGLIGSATIYTNTLDTLNVVVDSDTALFTSCACDIYTDTNGTGILSIAAEIDLSAANTLTYPYMLIYLSDTVPQTYVFDSITLPMLETWEQGIRLSLLTDANRYVYVESDTSWIVSAGGMITVTNFSDYGSSLNASFSNIPCYRLTESTLEFLHNMHVAVQNGDLSAIAYMATFNITDLFTPVLVSGTIEGRRMNITGILDDVDV